MKETNKHLLVPKNCAELTDPVTNKEIWSQLSKF